MNGARQAAAAGGVDIGATLDAGPFSAMQGLAVLLAALSIVLDGFDGQLIGFAIPALIRDWHLAREAFVPAVAAGLVGMGLGSAAAGPFADRFGRRRAVILSVFVFGAATCAIGAAQDIAGLAALRFVAGLGIGGALPTATTLTAEFTPARYRTLMVTATIVCVPLGGMLAGLFAHAVLPVQGWRGLFVAGGALPLLLGVVLLATLPESPRYLARHRARWPELGRLLARMRRPVAADAAFSDSVERHAAAAAGADGREQRIVGGAPSARIGAERRGFRALFADGLAGDTLALWCAFFMSLLAVYSAFSWLPAMLAAQGLSVDVAGSGLTAYNLGGVIGALGCALAIARWGSRWPLVLSALGGAASAAALFGVDVASQRGWLLLGLGLHGLFVNAVQATMYALCAHLYATPVRATGTAGALMVGRLGAIFSAFAGAWVIGAGGKAAYLAMLVVSMTIAALALAVLLDHVKPLRAQRIRREGIAGPSR
ncbi:MFS transporter [Burkholderia gladioli]|uniref:MFS transporter n=1 Tax=Burkholderia gladioli TaxID=28095 RepID=UPI000CFF8935|nr:MFS transporter [Burkholderia gladioli]MBU9276645.1 MFS transporter [Burkholderia gladioli]PRE20887.1 MFS transporter [Burkholderia gladioli]